MILLYNYTLIIVNTIHPVDKRIDSCINPPLYTPSSVSATVTSSRNMSLLTSTRSNTLSFTPAITGTAAERSSSSASKFILV